MIHTQTHTYVCINIKNRYLLGCKTKRTKLNQIMHDKLECGFAYCDVLFIFVVVVVIFCIVVVLVLVYVLVFAVLVFVISFLFVVV